MEALILTTPEQLQEIISSAVRNEFSKYPLSAPAQTAPPKVEYLTRTEVKRLFKISYPTLRLWTNEGVIQAYRIGTTTRYKSDELDEALKVVKSTKALA